MTVVSCQHVKKYYGANTVLADVTFEIGGDERVGLIGPNGCGKTTLLQVVAGLQKADDGQLSIQKRTRIGYLSQIPLERGDVTVYDVLALGYRDVLNCRATMLDLEAQMAVQDPPISERRMAGLLKAYAEQQEEFQRLGGYEMEAHILQVAQGLGITPEQFGRRYATFSGGEKTKIGLASLLLERPTLLLLDEPTNHLDTPSVEWLETFLTTYDGACIIVSHDRYFLDRVVTKIIELEDGEATIFQTNYSGYVKEKEELLLQQFADFKEQQKKIKKMEETIRQLQEWGRIGANEKFFRRAASMQKALDRMERLKRPILERKAADFDLQEMERSGREVVKLEGLSKRYGARPLLDHIEAALFYGEKVVLVGKNGAGKSTLFKLLLGQEQPDGGKAALGARVEIGYLAQQDHPEDQKSVLQVYCDQAKVDTGEGRSQLARYLFFGADVFKSITQLSGGEWTRLRLALLMQQKPNLLLLDEPTNHLDIASREALEEALEDFPGTVLAVSHDRYFINRIAQRVWELQDGKLAFFLGNYDDYREKREQLRLAREQSQTEELARPAQTKKAVAVQVSREQSRREEAAKRAKVQLELAIAQMEKRLAELDTDLAKDGADLARLTALWADREATQGELDRLYAQWMELDGSE